MFTERTSIGLDVHARSIAAAAIDGVTGELFQTKLPPSFDGIRSWVADLPGPVAVAYEAGPTGFGLYRALTSAGIRCEVVAPSKLQRPSGDRVKTDAKDAVHLARLLRLDEITPVAVPAVAQEAARDLVRAREDCRADLMRARHRLSKLLLRHGIVYDGGQAWTTTHDAWLRRQQLDTTSMPTVNVCLCRCTVPVRSRARTAYSAGADESPVSEPRRVSSHPALRARSTAHHPAQPTLHRAPPPPRSPAVGVSRGRSRRARARNRRSSRR